MLLKIAKPKGVTIKLNSVEAAQAASDAIEALTAAFSEDKPKE